MTDLSEWLMTPAGGLCGLAVLLGVVALIIVAARRGWRQALAQAAEPAVVVSPAALDALRSALQEERHAIRQRLTDAQVAALTLGGPERGRELRRISQVRRSYGKLLWDTNFGLGYLNSGHPREAQRTWEYVLARTPIAAAAQGLGLLHGARREWEAALAADVQAAELRAGQGLPPDVGLAQHRAEMCVELGRLTDALAAYGEAQRLHLDAGCPADPARAWRMALVCLELGEPAQAAVHAEEAARLYAEQGRAVPERVARFVAQNAPRR